METNTFLKHGEWERIKKLLNLKNTIVVNSKKLSIKNGCWMYDPK